MQGPLAGVICQLHSLRTPIGPACQTVIQHAAKACELAKVRSSVVACGLAVSDMTLYVECRPSSGSGTLWESLTRTRGVTSSSSSRAVTVPL